MNVKLIELLISLGKITPQLISDLESAYTAWQSDKTAEAKLQTALNAVMEILTLAEKVV